MATTLNPHECGEEYMTEDAAWARCVHAKGHGGKCWDGIGPSSSTRRSAP